MVLVIQKLFNRNLLRLNISSCRCLRSASYSQTRSKFSFAIENPHEAGKEFKNRLSEGFIVTNDFITEQEEDSLLKDLEKTFRRSRYQYDHWDGAIVGYRETEKASWSNPSQTILNHLQNVAFGDGSTTLGLTHVLDLAEDGCIKPHIDSVKFCGSTIAGLSLLSPCIMRLKEESTGCIADVVLKRRSLYIMRDHIRFNCSHEVLSNGEPSYIRETIHKSRRISLIMRNQPK